MKKIFFGTFILMLLIFIIACSPKIDTDTINSKEDNYNIQSKTAIHSTNSYEDKIKLTGRMTLWEVTVKSKSRLEITSSLNNLRGKLLIAITDNDTYIEYIENISNAISAESTHTIELGKGVYYIKLLGNKTSVNLAIELFNANTSQVKINKVDQLEDDLSDLDDI